MTDGFDKWYNILYSIKVIYVPLGKHYYNKHTFKMILCPHFTQTQFVPHRKNPAFIIKDNWLLMYMKILMICIRITWNKRNLCKIQNLLSLGLLVPVFTVGACIYCWCLYSLLVPVFTADACI